MQKDSWRPPKNYDGTRPTGRRLADLIPRVLKGFQRVYEEKGDLIREKWPEIIGPQLAAMTEISGFSNGVLEVSVKNATLYALLCTQNDKQAILKRLRGHFPELAIRSLLFRRR